MNKKILIEDYKPIIQEKLDDDEDDERNLVNTPFGIYRMNDSMNPVRQFKLKLVDINFPLTIGIKAIIDRIAGIEVFFPITQYKFIIGIGKAFDEKEVIQNLRNTLIGKKDVDLFNNKESNLTLNDLIEKLKGTNKFWVIYALPNGNLDYSYETDKMYPIYKEAQKYSKGQIIISEKFQEKLKNERNN